MNKTYLIAVLFYALGVLTIFGCATAFPYRYYATDMPTDCYDKGTLFGKTGTAGWPDMPLDQCKPDGSMKLKCITVLVDDFYAAKADDEKCHSDLIACQKGPKP